MSSGLVKVGGSMAAGARLVRRVQEIIDIAAAAHARVDADMKARLKAEVERAETPQAVNE